VSQVNDSGPCKVTEQNGRAHYMNGELARMLAKKLESRGLDFRLVTYPSDADDDEHVEEIVITNPVARERGEMRVGDDGSVTWEYFGRLDEAGVSNIVDEATNAAGNGRSTRPGLPVVRVIRVGHHGRDLDDAGFYGRGATHGNWRNQPAADHFLNIHWGTK
jgi:hypothetical protein